MLEITDSHAHLDAQAFDEDRDVCVSRALAAGVTRILTVGAGYGAVSAQRAVELAEKHPNVWASVGLHPHDASLGVDLESLRLFAQHPKVVAIGETGLDFVKELSPRHQQVPVFEQQVLLALEVGKPLIIHSRGAGEECLETLCRLGADAVGGVFHCYAEDAEFAAKLKAIGFLVSFPGLLTFKKSGPVRDICRAIPMEQILVETDAPYMAPEPYRGKRCESAFVVETLKCLATLKGISPEDAAQVTTQNALRLFSHMR